MDQLCGLESFHPRYPYQKSLHCQWKEDREEEPKAHVNKQKSSPKPGREQRDVFERILGWINRGETLQVGMALEYALDAFEEMARERAKGMSEGSCDCQEKTD